MKANIEFNLPEEQDEFECAVDATKWKKVCEDFANKLRNHWKYGADVNAEGLINLEKIKEEFFDCLHSEGLSL
jgi:hypothetical protein